jgi:hypothetical protein
MSATNGYPFLTKKAISERIRGDRAYALEMFRLLLARTSQRTVDTRGASGFMASHAGTVRGIAATLEERALDDAEHLKLATLLSHYTKQLAAHFRTLDLQARPELLQVASVFSAIPGVALARSEAEVDDGAAEEEADSLGSGDGADVENPVVDQQHPAPRRRGRPKGSKNRPKEERKRGGRRR